MLNDKNKTCCFFGHRKISVSAKLKSKLYDMVEKMIAENAVDTFLFGSKSQFNELAYDVVSELKEKYSHIKRIYVRAEYPYIDDDYKSYLLEKYEDTYYPENMIGAGKASYVERNQEMIKNSFY